MNLFPALGITLALILLSMPAMGEEVWTHESRPEVRPTYENPLQLSNEWPDYGIGDPYILRWNGRYYLYPSTSTHGGGHEGVRVWSSTDLVTWTYEGYATREPVTRGAYAPEVVYWNGVFYMYTSPGGNGHYVLTSESPTGPFEVQTGNLGLTIDGSVFIDDDGTWYFTHAGFRGIRAHRMTDPFTVGRARILEADLGHWTEGSMIIKRDGRYFLTYTGNHVLSKGYRVHYAVSNNGPLGPYREGSNNPIIISTEEGFSGLGHSATVLGPDLDSYYITYHNRVERDGPLLRRMNIDRLVFNGDKMAVLGPTDFPQPVPQKPDFFAWVDEEGAGDRWFERVSDGFKLLVSREETGPVYTAEFNYQIEDDGDPTETGEIGAVFSYRDEDEFLYALVSVGEGTLTLYRRRDSESHLLGRVRLPEEFDFRHLHTVRVVRTEDRLRLFFDGMLEFDAPMPEGPGGRIGYIARGVRPRYRFTAFSGQAGGSSDFDAPKPVPGEIEVVHYVSKDGYGAASPAATNPFRPGDGTTIERTEAGSYAVRLSRAGDWLRYVVNTAADGRYGVDVTVKTPVSASAVEVLVDGTPRGMLSVPEMAKRVSGGWMKIRAGYVDLEAGLHALTVRLVQGELALAHFDFYPVVSEPYSMFDPLTEGADPVWKTYGAVDWTSTNTGYRLRSAGESMAIFGESGWTDYAVGVDMLFDRANPPGEAGVLVRATHPSYHPDQVRDAVLSYYAAVSKDEIVLKKLRYDAKTVARAPVSLNPGVSHRLEVAVTGGVIRVYWDGAERPVIEYADPQAFTYGAAGLRASTTAVSFRNLAVRCLSCPVYGKIEIGEDAVWLDPERERYALVLPFGTLEPPEIKVVPLRALRGAKVIDSEARIEVEASRSLPGEALIRVVGRDGELLHRATVALTSERTPNVRVGIGANPPTSDGWAGTVTGTVAVEVDAGGPDSLLHRVRLTLAPVEAGQVGEPKEIYTGSGVPRGLSLDTRSLGDGTFELRTEVVTVYETRAEAVVRFSIQNWVKIDDPLLPPLETFWGPRSRMETVEEAAGWSHATASPDLFFGDEDRLIPPSSGPAYLVWEAKELSHFVVTLYARSRDIRDAVHVLVASKPSDWREAPYVTEAVDASDGWHKIELAGDATPHAPIRFLRLEVSDMPEVRESIQLGRVEIWALRQ